MTVAAILNSKGPEVVAIRPDQTLEAAAKLMTERRIGSVLVMDGEDVAGILSERDIVRAIAGHGVAALAMPVAGAMTREVVFGQPADTVDRVLALMTERRIRHLPVKDKGRLVGLVSIGDVVKKRIEDVEQEAEGLRAFVHGAG
ncbi:CBS domain-containing protein [Elioraea sp.]|jgi:CBS domain-containing protein|uniref:CBS domain-containing protein n=1 Tax=Elioraea sp. TaxID=2185103 RepID=UPI0021DCCC84|nr:CBS domain-containing protein [Elioraea sp.]GIX09448.1 MAG: inosine-5-monophosphate dehydrogenase [Elioraea sp.]